VEEMSVVGTRKLVPSAWNIPMKDERRMSRIGLSLRIGKIGCFGHTPMKTCQKFSNLQNFTLKMYMDIVWGEIHHEDIDNRVVEYLKAMNTLQECGLQKKFTIPNLHAQKPLLQMLIGY
jgi:hypothetical protein